MKPAGAKKDPTEAPVATTTDRTLVGMATTAPNKDPTTPILKYLNDNNETITFLSHMAINTAIITITTTTTILITPILTMAVVEGIITTTVNMGTTITMVYRITTIVSILMLLRE